MEDLPLNAALAHVALSPLARSPALRPRTRSPALAALLPPQIVAIVATAQHWQSPLLPAEADYLAGRRMQPQRKAEFRAGRACAREALARFGISGWALLPAATRDPQWPPGFVGSISHSDSYCAAAVARRATCAGLGIDVQRLDRVGAPITGAVCTPREREQIHNAPRHARRVLLSLFFSAKESVFKAVFPATRRFFEFNEVEIDLDFELRRFTARTTQADGERIFGGLKGRFEIGTHYVLTAALLEPHVISSTVTEDASHETILRNPDGINCAR